MEHQLWKEIVAVLSRIGKHSRCGRESYSDVEIVKTWFWAVLHDRPVSWACRATNWPIYARRCSRPSPSRMSRRLRTDRVRRLLLQVERDVLAPRRAGLVWMMDGKPLVISGCSKDRQAGYGRAAGGKAKGYKIHVLIDDRREIAAWRVAPMNKDERVMAERMLSTADVQGYVLADSNFDSNKLHAVCTKRGNLQLVTRRRYGPDRGHGHRPQTAARLRSKAILENPDPRFGNALYAQRETIERYYGTLTNWGGGLTHLPPWIRTYRRVHRWVQAKLILNALRQRIRTTNYVA
jgi:hypothetical protein